WTPDHDGRGHPRPATTPTSPSMNPAVDDAVADGLVERHAEGLVLTEAGFGVFRGIMGDGFAQLRDRIETQNDAPLTDDDLAELRTFARGLILTEGDFSPRPSVH
ncbi:MAG TPA: hypothetical protein PKL25_07860, partial [Phycicoccus elongatus]|nr:hypothetical protein [Phycicoccus elongatus]